MSMLSWLLRRDEAPPDGPVVIESMRRRDLRDVLRIEHQVYPRPWSPGVFQTELDLSRRGERRYVVARIDGRLVGYSGVMYNGDEAHVTNIAVDPVAHRRGIGTCILADQARAARSHGSSAMSLEVRHTNVAAQELYRRFGFVPAGIRRRYYENTDDAIVMWCHDLAAPEYEDRLRALEAGEPDPDREPGP